MVDPASDEAERRRAMIRPSLAIPAVVVIAPGGRVRAAARDDSASAPAPSGTVTNPRPAADVPRAGRRRPRASRSRRPCGRRHGSSWRSRSYGISTSTSTSTTSAWGCEDARRERGVAEGERESTLLVEGTATSAAPTNTTWRSATGARRPDELPRGPGRPGEPDHGHQLRRGAPAVHGAQRGVLEARTAGRIFS